jgi:VWFA-related protein
MRSLSTLGLGVRAGAWSRVILLTAAAGALGSAGAFAQTQGPVKPSQPPPPPQQTQQPQGQPLRIVTRLVSAPAVVRNNKGEMVLDLDKKDFSVSDNGVKQVVDHFDIGGDPVSAVLVVETSGRIAPMLPSIQKAGIVFTDAVLGETGEGAVISYDSEVTTVSPFTSNYDALEKVISRLPQGADNARLFDGMAAAINMLRDQPEDRRRVIVIVGEPVDHGSGAKIGELLREAQISNISIYSVGISVTAAQLRQTTPTSPPLSPTPPGTYGDPPIPGTPQTPTTEDQRTGGGEGGGGVNLLNLAVWAVKSAAGAVKANPLELAAVGTGGEYVGSFHDSSIEKGLDRIAGELHAQYTIAYHPTGVPSDGYHEIVIQVDRPGLKVQTRPGYYLPPEGSGN